MAEHEEHGGGGGGAHEEGHGGGGSHGGGGHGGGGHGGGEHEESGAPEWLISFADNVALMMGFFVILLAMNMGPKATKASPGEPSPDATDSASDNAKLDWVIGLRKAFNGAPFDKNSNNPDERRAAQREQERADAAKNDGPEGTGKKAQTVRDSDFTGLGGVVYFEDNTDLLSTSSKEVIQQVATKLRDQRWVVEVRGHVSPFECGRSPEKAMALSNARAMMVARELSRHSVPWPQLRVVSVGTGDPAKGRSATQDQDRTNQRVEIVVTKQALPPDVFAAPAAEKH